MSAVVGVNRTKIVAGGLSNALVRGEVDGRVKVLKDTYEAAALANGSTIQVGPTLPTGARIIEVILNTDNLQNSTTLAVGDSDTAARYISATDHGSAALVTRLNVIGGSDYVIGTNNGDNIILITTGAGEATGTIEIAILYTQD